MLNKNLLSFWFQQSSKGSKGNKTRKVNYLSLNRDTQHGFEFAKLNGIGFAKECQNNRNIYQNIKFRT